MYGFLNFHFSVSEYETSISVSNIKSCRVEDAGYDLSCNATKFWGVLEMPVIQTGMVRMFTICSFAICYTTEATGLFYRRKVPLSGLYVAVENAEHPLSLLEGNEPKQSTDCAMASRLMASVIIP